MRSIRTVGLLLGAFTVGGAAAWLSGITGDMSDGQASLIGSAVGAAFSVAAAFVAVSAGQAAEQRQLKDFVRATLEALREPIEAIGTMRAERDDSGAWRLNAEGWKRYQSLVADLTLAGKEAQARLKRIDQVAYKLDARSLTLLMIAESRLLPAVFGFCRFFSEYVNQAAVLENGGQIPPPLSHGSGAIDGAMASVIAELTSKH